MVCDMIISRMNHEKWNCKCLPLSNKCCAWLINCTRFCCAITHFTVEIWPNRTIWSLFEIEGTVDGVCSVETPNKKLRSKNRNAAIARHALWFATAMEISFESSSPVRIGQAFGDNGVDEEAAQVQAELKLEGRKDKIYPFLHLKLRCKNIFFFINKKN